MLINGQEETAYRAVTNVHRKLPLSRRRSREQPPERATTSRTSSPVFLSWWQQITLPKSWSCAHRLVVSPRSDALLQSVRTKVRATVEHCLLTMLSSGLSYPSRTLPERYRASTPPWTVTQAAVSPDVSPSVNHSYVMVGKLLEMLSDIVQLQDAVLCYPQHFDSLSGSMCTYPYRRHSSHCCTTSCRMGSYIAGETTNQEIDCRTHCGAGLIG